MTTEHDIIKHGPTISADGLRPCRAVIRRWNQLTPFVVHTQYLDDVGGFEDGAYCRTEDEAETAFAKRMDRLHRRAQL